MGIREEFEKAFDKTYDDLPSGRSGVLIEVALFGAKWMAERCAKEIDGIGRIHDVQRIRQMAKELS